MYLSWYSDAGLPRRLEKFADGAHRPVLYIFTIQNRELPYANVRLGKPVKNHQIFDHGILEEFPNRQNDI
jgi:hypothetical protein